MKNYRIFYILVVVLGLFNIPIPANAKPFIYIPFPPTWFEERELQEPPATFERELQEPPATFEIEPQGPPATFEIEPQGPPATFEIEPQRPSINPTTIERFCSQSSFC